jgi:WD40 repeat protein
MKIVVVLANNLLGAAIVPTKATANRMIPMPADEAKIHYRKIDKGSNLVISNEINGDIFVSGEDKLLKKYLFPEETITQIDYKRAPQAPIDEFTSHSIGTTCWDVTKEFKFMATGGKDGSILLRHINNVGQQPQPIKGHAMFSGGVTALCFS